MDGRPSTAVLVESRICELFGFHGSCLFIYIFFMLDKITESEENINGTVVTFKGKFVLATNGNRLCVRAHFFFRWLAVCGANFAER